MSFIAVIAGSKSDQKITTGVCQILDEFGVKYETKIISAHRNRAELEKYLQKSKADVFIAIAGLSAHLPGVIASVVNKPVIGVPVSAMLGGLDALLSIVQMPTRVPVACVGIDNGKNAALLAVEILSIRDKKLSKKLSEYRNV